MSCRYGWGEEVELLLRSGRRNSNKARPIIGPSIIPEAPSTHHARSKNEDVFLSFAVMANKPCEPTVQYLHNYLRYHAPL